MDINTERSKELKSYLKSNPRQEEKDLKAPVFLGGKNQYLPVFRIPIKLLMYNIRNGRFAAELMSKERELGGHILDATNTNDSKILRDLLLNQNPLETEVLRESIKEYGQLQPGLVTFDGAVINANRRMAVLSKLYEETSDDKYAYLKTAILEKGVGAKDLWRIEAGLQFAKDLRLDYGPVNELLKLREGVKSKLTYTEISRSLEGRYSAKDVEGRLEILNLIDNYLASIDKPNEYMLFQAQRKVEQFNSLHDNVLASIKKRLGDKNGNKIAAETIPLAFRLIESQKVDYRDVRKLKDIMLDETAKKSILDGFNPLDRKPETLKGLAEKFNVANEIVDAKLDQDRPKYLVEKALVLVSGIDSKHKAVQNKDFIELLNKLKLKIEELLDVKQAKKR
ncbi:MAG: hypothetical protein WC821_05380 [archaeon]|jgi:hypothetical protein